MALLKNILFTFLLPLFLLKDIYRSDRNLGRKIGYFILTIIVIGLIWKNGYQEILSLFKQTSYESGITDKITKVQVSGTSMLPTIIDGSEIELRNPQKYGVARGDIVSFTNEETRGLHYLKRIIGQPGEEISIKNGAVFINGRALQEDYTLNALPTYGNTSIIDCENYIIPGNQYMVLGDNRTVSSDSRVLGFINEDDIDGVIKTNIQEKFIEEHKQDQITKIKINPEIFLKELNQRRLKESSSSLVTYAVINQLADKRAGQIRDKFDEWKTQSAPLDKMLEDTGYRFNKVHEFVTFGYLDELAIIDQIFDSANEKDQFLSTQYTEAGIGVTEKVNKGCTFPVVSVILSWPAIPTYDKTVIDSWLNEININNQSLSNLQTWVGVSRIDQVKLKQLIDKVAQAQQIATKIYNKEKNREWLTPKDIQDIKLHGELVDEAQDLSKELFGDVKGISTSSKLFPAF